MNSPIKGLILCAGNGTRLKPITQKVQKTLVPIANKPTISYGLYALAEAGITDIGIVVRSNQEEIIRYCGDGKKFGVNITFIYQNSPKGTGDAIRVASDFIGDSPMIVYLGDNIYGQSLRTLIQTFVNEPASAYVTTKEVENPTDYGVVVVENNQVIHLQEKPKEPISNKALTGVYIFNSGVIKKFNNIVPSENGEIEMTTAVKNLINKEEVKYFEIKSWWEDIGKPRNLLIGNKNILREGGNRIHPDANIKNTKIIQPVSVEKGATIKNSIIGPSVSIGENCMINDSIIDDSIILNGAKATQVRLNQTIYYDDKIQINTTERNSMLVKN